MLSPQLTHSSSHMAVFKDHHSPRQSRLVSAVRGLLEPRAKFSAGNPVPRLIAYGLLSGRAR